MIHVSPDWLVQQYPELELIKNPENPAEDEIDFILKAQGDPRAGFFIGGKRDQASAVTRDAFWSRLKEEFRDLVCTDSPKYAELRKEFAETRKVADATVLASITAAIAAVLGAAVAALVPLVALCLYAFAKLGSATYCKLTEPSAK